MQNIENGSFLISHPTLLEDSFFKAIVLVTHHNFEETIGLVINHPSKIKLHEIIDDIPNSDFPVYIGGPVSKNSIHFIHSLGRLIPNSIKIYNIMNFELFNDKSKILYFPYQETPLDILQLTSNFYTDV